MTASARLRREKKTIAAMIAMRCRAVHGPEMPDLCDDCTRLRACAEGRIDACRFGSAKPVCNRCAVHCYSRPMREEIRRVMRFSGPRMLLAHPLLSARHAVDALRGSPRP